MFHVEQIGGFAQTLIEGSSQFGVSLTAQQISQFVLYLRELRAWNKKINLTAITQEQDIAVKHFLDSLACTQVISGSPSSSLLDIGTGAGFPGLPLKIIHPELKLTLLEPNQKKTAFLRHVIGTLNLESAVVIPKRIEDLVKELDSRHGFVHIVTRALDAAQILPFISSLLAPNGQFILCRSKPLNSIPNLSGLELSKEISYTLPYGYGKRVLSILTLDRQLENMTVPRGTSIK